METYNKLDSKSYCLGMSLTIEALLHKAKYIEKIVLSNKANKNNQLDYLLQLCELNNIVLVYDDSLIDKLSIKENCYCIGIFNKFYNNLDSKKHIVLYEFNDYGELGTILRSSVSFDFHDIVIVNSDIDYFDPRCIRASMGSIFHCNIVHYDKLMDYINDYPDNFIYPFVPNGGHELCELKAYEPYSVIIPQEYRGLCKEFKEGYYVKHKNLNEMSLSSLSSIVLSYLYHQTI
ncbi:MAG: TrmH family RNA methyltransferase [Erysipelotrichaceae bacterium]|nr:TrmH family RNA methyltransferase [Erysipelotrichaceae bacterium]